MIYLHKGSGHYDLFKYPGGELQVRLSKGWQESLPFQEKQRIKAVILDPEDIMTLILLVSAIRGASHNIRLHLKLAYVPYARADRRFVPGDCFGMEAFANIINSLHFHTVTGVDVHSDQVFKFIANFASLESADYISKSIVDFAEMQKASKINVLLPDEGASARYTIPTDISCNIRSIQIKKVQCSKVRDAVTGKLSGFVVPEFEGPGLIVDDICDGGGTFLGIAKMVPGRPLGLFSTHGLYSQGTGELLKYFDRLYCTDSLWPLPEVAPKGVIVYAIKEL